MSCSNLVKWETPIMRSIATQNMVRAESVERFPHPEHDALADAWFDRLYFDARKTTQILDLMRLEVRRVLTQLVG